MTDEFNYTSADAKGLLLVWSFVSQTDNTPSAAWHMVEPDGAPPRRGSEAAATMEQSAEQRQQLRLMISYCSEARTFIERLVALLEALGYVVWWDRHLAIGAPIGFTIERAIRTADHVLVVWCPRAVDPMDGMWVHAEAHQALRDGKYMPVRLGDFELPLPFKQFHAPDVSAWTGDTDCPVILPLLRQLELRQRRT